MTGRVSLRRSWDPLAIDDHTADRLLLGLLEPADSPPLYRDVALRFQDLRADATGSERAAAATALPRLVAELDEGPAPAAPALARGVGRGSARLKVLALGCVASLSLTTGLGLAGALPDGPQQLVASVLDGVGVGAPSPGPTKPAPPNPAPGSSARPAPGVVDTAGVETSTTTAPAAGPGISADPGNAGGSGGGRPASGSPGGSGNAPRGGSGGPGNANAGGNGNGHASGNGNGHASGGGNGNAGGNGNGNAGGNGNGHRH